ncbi:MAG: competence/damage-inducible protein A [Rhizobacter sp.]|nr:competence/damage-inducible protein A [Ferruginibacter sp.]
MVNVSIITIGDELLIGQVIDTNSAWMAQELNKAGIRVKRRVAVGDVWDEIWKALDEEAVNADVILITGGLGPTADDITKPLLCKYFGGTLVTDSAALENVRYLFESIFKRPLTDRNIKQGEVPDVCTVIQNKRGTAPGMLFRKEGKVFVSMPGVPHEMQGMMTNDVIPLLITEFSPGQISHRTLLTFGIGESMLADMIQEFEETLPANIKLAYLPNSGMVRLRLTASGPDAVETEKLIDTKFAQLQELVKEFIVTNTDEPMEKVLGKLLLQKNKTLATAESCTGGYIAHLMTVMPGSSAFYNGSIVTYSNETKSSLLGVPPEVLTTEGAVSEPVVLQMVKAVLKTMDTDYGLAVSGIMGPDGGSEAKPVGTVWIAVGNVEKQIAQQFNFRFDRQRNIHFTAINALNMMRKFVLDDEGQ